MASKHAENYDLLRKLQKTLFWSKTFSNSLQDANCMKIICRQISRRSFSFYGLNFAYFDQKCQKSDFLAKMCFFATFYNQIQCFTLSLLFKQTFNSKGKIVTKFIVRRHDNTNSYLYAYLHFQSPSTSSHTYRYQCYRVYLFYLWEKLYLQCVGIFLRNT